MKFVILEKSERMDVSLGVSSRSFITRKEHRVHFYREMIHCIHVDTWEYHIVFKHPFILIQEVHQESEQI